MGDQLGKILGLLGMHKGTRSYSAPPPSCVVVRVCEREHCRAEAKFILHDWSKQTVELRKGFIRRYCLRCGIEDVSKVEIGGYDD